MSVRRRDPLVADRAAARRAQHIASHMPSNSAEIDAAMKRVIRDALSSGRDINRGDFLRALVRADEIEPRFKRLLAEVKDDLAKERRT